jgi:hypothetical protein
VQTPNPRPAGPSFDGKRSAQVTKPGRLARDLLATAGNSASTIWSRIQKIQRRRNPRSGPEAILSKASKGNLSMQNGTFCISHLSVAFGQCGFGRIHPFAKQISPGRLQSTKIIANKLLRF